MRVKSCAASDGAGHVIKLTDEFGCVLRPKMISRFLKARAPNEKATVITYAFFHAFKFPDALSVHIKCKVEICRHGCLDHCQLTGSINERKDTVFTIKHQENHESNELNEQNEHQEHLDDGDDNDSSVHDIFYDDIIHNSDEISLAGKHMALMKNSRHHLAQKVAEVHEDIDDIPPSDQPLSEMLKNAEYFDSKKAVVDGDDQFPHGPRHLEAKDRIGMPAVAGPRSLNLDSIDGNFAYVKENSSETNPKRRRRSIVISDRKVRSADVGVSGLYDVISEADLAFSPDMKQEAVTVFQGKIGEDIVYGICMPVPGFSVLFIVVVSAAIISALVAGSLLYRYQLQKETFAMQKNGGDDVNMEHTNTIASWMTLRLFRMRQCASNEGNAES